MFPERSAVGVLLAVWLCMAACFHLGGKTTTPFSAT